MEIDEGLSRFKFHARTIEPTLYRKSLKIVSYLIDPANWLTKFDCLLVETKQTELS